MILLLTHTKYITLYWTKRCSVSNRFAYDWWIIIFTNSQLKCQILESLLKMQTSLGERLVCIFFLETAPSAHRSARSHFPRLTFSFTMQVDLSYLYSAQTNKGQFKNRIKKLMNLKVKHFLILKCCKLGRWHKIKRKKKN